MHYLPSDVCPCIQPFLTFFSNSLFPPPNRRGERCHFSTQIFRPCFPTINLLNSPTTPLLPTPSIDFHPLYPSSSDCLCIPMPMVLEETCASRGPFPIPFSYRHTPPRGPFPTFSSFLNTLGQDANITPTTASSKSQAVYFPLPRGAKLGHALPATLPHSLRLRIPFTFFPLGD